MAPQTEQKIYVGIGLDFETGGLDCRECACTQIALQAVRFDTWQVFDRYQAYIAPYGKQDAGLPRRKVLRTRHEQAKGQEYVPMKYEQAALDYSAITMEMLRTQGMDMKKVAGEVIAFAKRATLSKGNQCKPVLVGQNIAFDIGFLQQLVNYAGLAAEFEKTFSGSRDYYGNFQPHYIDTLALGRLAFAADPERLTPAGRAILLNSIVYASKFNGQKLIARKMNEGIVTRDHLPMTKWACTRKANDYINETNLTFRQMIDSVHAVAVEKKNKGEELSRFEAIYLDMPQMPPVVKKSFGQYLKERNPKLYEVFGTDEAAYADYYEKNAPYMRPDLRGYELVIDPEVQALGIPNNDIRLLDKAIELMEQGNPDGKTILERYTLKRFATPAAGRPRL